MSDLDEAWLQLARDRDPGGGFARLRLSLPDQPALYAGRRRADGREALLLEVATGSLPAGLQLPKPEGLELGALPTEPGPGGRTCLHITRGEDRFQEIFLALARDVLESVAGAAGDENAVACFVNRIARWQAFLREHGPDGLSPEGQRGLYGELWLLERLLNLPLSEGVAVGAWRGPERASHDFQLPVAAIEVKTTIAASPRTIRVSNPNQLDGRGLPALFLFFLQLEESAAADLSLPDLVLRLRSRLSERPLELLNEGLFNWGYTDEQFESGDVRGLAVRGERWFEVSDGFPRILDADLPEGVVDVTFSVQLAACAPFERDAGKVEQVLRKAS